MNSAAQINRQENEWNIITQPVHHACVTGTSIDFPIITLKTNCNKVFHK